MNTGCIRLNTSCCAKGQCTIAVYDNFFSKLVKQILNTLSISLKLTELIKSLAIVLGIIGHATKNNLCFFVLKYIQKDNE